MVVYSPLGQPHCADPRKDESERHLGGGEGRGQRAVMGRAMLEELPVLVAVGWYLPLVSETLSLLGWTRGGGTAWSREKGGDQEGRWILWRSQVAARDSMDMEEYGRAWERWWG